MTNATQAVGIDIRELLDEQDRTRKTALLQYFAQRFRIDVFDILHEKGTGHWGGAASVAELLVSLYFDVMRIRPDDPRWPDRDRLVLGKGHASCMLYAVLANRGYFPPDELHSFRQLNSRLQGHPCMKRTPGVDMSTGSLGHGTSVGLGMALAARSLRRDFWTYVVLGDGDLNEGETWEAIMSGAKFKPERLVVLVDYNKVQLDGPSEIIMPMDPLQDKFRAFRWNVAPKIYDGHSVGEILESFAWAKTQVSWPLAIIYQTHKGRGVSFMEDNSYWHGSPIDDKSYAAGRPELIEGLRRLEAQL